MTIRIFCASTLLACAALTLCRASSAHQIFATIAGPSAQGTPQSGPTRSPAAGKTYQHPNGFIFQYPADWRVEGRGEFTELIPADSKSEMEEYRLLTAPISLPPTDPQFEAELGKLFAAANFQRSGRTEPFKAVGGPGAAFTWEGIDPQSGRAVRMRVLAVTLGQQAVLIFAAGTRPRLEAREAALRDLAASLTPRKQAVPKALGNDNSPLAQQWVQRLSGQKLTYLSSYNSGGGAGGYSAKTVIVLGADGRFSFSSNSSVSVDVGGASGNSGGVQAGEGRWRIYAHGNQAVLELNFSTGHARQYRLSYEDRKTFLNGQRYFVTEP